MNIGITDVAGNGRLLAYYVRKGGADEVEQRFFDVDTMREIGSIPSARYYGFSLSPDNHTAYYARMTSEGPRVFRRAITGGPEEKLFGDGYGREKIIDTSLSDDGFYLLIQVLHGSAAPKIEVYLKDLRVNEPVRTIVNDVDARFTAMVAGDKLVILTDWNAPNQRVMVADIANPAPAKWREIVPENKKAAIQDMNLGGARIFLEYLEDVRARLVRYTIDGRADGEMTFDTHGNIDDVRGSWSSPVTFVRFSSFHVPPTIYSYDVARNERTVFAQIAAPVDSSQFTLEQAWYASKDGTRVPMWLLYKKGLKRDGTAPVYLTGYGGFASSQLPTFLPRAIAWAEMGGVYALPNLRGGGEFGEAWHRAAMLESKQKTYDDFIGAAEYLIRERYTSSKHLSIAGRSQGGLLVMSLVTQRPDLVEAAVCGFPLIDMLRYHKFLVGSFWVPEYGDPDNPEQFRFIYSPYHHVKEGTDYPAIYFYTGDADTRVAPLHGRKQAANGGDEPIVLRYHTAGGHSGGEPLTVSVAEEAERLAFLWWQTR